ncbi:MAG: Spy/CpxP family protein refolding chaperone [Proteobacteria bacterium]|nr:Spy/CpxP family protein refolding chaperone [Pseudomonadota bacterium]
MRKIIIVAAILVAAIGCAMFVPAIGASSHGWRGEHGMDMGSHMYAKLDLTDAQRSQIKQLTQQSVAQAKPQMQALRQARLAYESATPGTAAYQTAASNLAQMESDAARTHVTQRADLRAQIYQLLTPAQQTQLAQIQAQRAARMQQWKASRQQNTQPQSSSGTPEQ